MYKRYAALIAVFFVGNLFACAQPLSAYVSMQNELMVWDKGMIHKVDYLPPVDMKIGRSTIPYLDNSRSFKIYYGGSVKNINAGFTNAFFVTDNLVAYLNQKSLNVFDRGQTKNLTTICNQYTVADSVVMFLDGLKNEYRVYYNNQIYTLENFIPDSVLTAIKVSDNIVAFNNFANQFRIFYRGSIIAQEDYQVYGFDAGRNIVAYLDANRVFKVFSKGKTITLEDYAPISFTAGDNLVAYVSGDGYFKIFYEDSVRTIGYFNPSMRVVDNIVAYKDPSGFLKVFYKGEITEVDNYFPQNMTIQYNSLAYLSTNSTLRLFTEGEMYDVTNADLSSWQLNYDVITYQIGQSVFKIYYKGNDY
jgi:hypothetical protein